MWMLDSEGGFNHFSSPPQMAGLLLDPSQISHAYTPDFSKIPASGFAFRILFKHSHDGRGFSYARRLSALRKVWGKDFVIIAIGHILPDQAALCFRSGFDQILVEDALVARHGLQAWREALLRVVPAQYFVQGEDQQEIWRQRRQSA